MPFKKQCRVEIENKTDLGSSHYAQVILDTFSRYYIEILRKLNIHNFNHSYSRIWIIVQLD